MHTYLSLKAKTFILLGVTALPIISAYPNFYMDAYNKSSVSVYGAHVDGCNDPTGSLMVHSGPNPLPPGNPNSSTSFVATTSDVTPNMDAQGCIRFSVVLPDGTPDSSNYCQAEYFDYTDDQGNHTGMQDFKCTGNEIQWTEHRHNSNTDYLYICDGTSSC